MQTFDINQLNHAHRSWTVAWHAETKSDQTALPWTAIQANHLNNFALWHEEDIARRDDIPLERIREAKRNIDCFNQARNDAMERMDDWILNNLAQPNDAGGLHSETPGMMIDRLSIMALKEYHMAEQAARLDVAEDHRKKCAARVIVLQDQQADLTESLRLLLADLAAGRRRFKIYRQLKMYNDPTLNPQLYAQRASS